MFGNLGPKKRCDNLLGSIQLFLLLSLILHWALHMHVLSLIDLFAITAVFSALYYCAGVEWLDYFLLAVLVGGPLRACAEIIGVQLDLRFLATLHFCENHALVAWSANFLGTPHSTFLLLAPTYCRAGLLGNCLEFICIV